MHLLGAMADVITDVFGKFDGTMQITAGVTGNEIRDQKLVFPQPLVDLSIRCSESLIDFVGRFAHVSQHSIRHMLGSHLELTTDVVGTKFFEKWGLSIMYQIVIANT